MSTLFGSFFYRQERLGVKLADTEGRSQNVTFLSCSVNACGT